MKKILVPLHIIAAIIMIFAAQIIGNAVGDIFSANAAADYLTQAALYIGITMLLAILYSKYVLRFTCAEIGLSRKLPELKWVITAILLPLSVTAFYVLFVDGESVRADVGDVKSIWVYAVFCAGISSGICEELVFRGLVMRTVERAWNKPAAVLIPSLLFGALHITGGMRIADILLLLIAGTAVGVMFSLIAVQSKTIWNGALVHALWNTIIIGGIFVVETPEYGLSENCLYRYELATDNFLLTGGRFGIESALPAIAGYCVVSAAALIFIKKTKIKEQIKK